MKEGYWHRNYWLKNYWNNNYWGHYGKETVKQEVGGKGLFEERILEHILYQVFQDKTSSPQETQALINIIEKKPLFSDD